MKQQFLVSLQKTRLLKIIRPYLQLLRFGNILILAMSQLNCYFYLLDLNPGDGLPFLAIILLILSTVAAAAAGNVINDYFDQRSDAIDKPEKAAIVESLGKINVTRVYLVCLLTALGTAFLFDITVAAFWLTSYQLIISPLLFLYSYKLKKWPLVGNLTIAGLCAISLASVAFAFDVYNQSTCITGQQFWIYVVFAFLVTLFREIIKDIEDIEGDRMAGCRTIPIIFGKKAAVWLAALPLLLTLLIIFVLLALPKKTYVATFIFVALLAILFRLFRADKKTDFYQISQLTKWLMLPSMLLLI